jgi:hypothetical protein
MPKSKGNASAYILTQVVEAWRKAHPDEDPTSHELAEFAIANKLMQPDSRVFVDWAKEKIRRALRAETKQDAQGREVRVNHAYQEMRIVDGEPTQLTLWAGYDATPPKMEASVAWRRRSIVGDCVKLWNDWDSYNKNNSHGATLKPFRLDFKDDVEESQQPGTGYPDERPYGEDESEDEEA